MEKTMQGYEADLAKLARENKKDTQDYRDKKKVLDDHNNVMKEVRKEAGLQALSLKELKSLRASLYNEYARAVPGGEHRIRLEKELGAVNTRMNELAIGAKNTGMTFGKMADGFNKYFAVVTAGIAVFSGMVFSIKNMIKAQGELSDSLADIRKTTQMTLPEVEALNKSFGKIDTRTSRQDLRQMAVVAGQLGIAKEDIYSFVESVDKLNVALGDEIKGGAEEVSTSMGKLRNVLTDMKSSNISDDMLRLGNAVNELGAAGFATAPVIVDFASRIGGVGMSLGLTSDEVLGISATLQELNVSTERGGTAVVKILQKMTTETKTFAGVAGIPIKEFENMINTDLFGAFIKVMEGSKRSGQSATELASIIKDLEVQGAGASEVFAKFGGSTEMLRQKVTLAGESLQGTGSIMEEFKTKNETLGAKLDKLSKNFYNLITMPGITRFFAGMVDGVISLVAWLKDLPLIIEKYKIALILVTGATLTWIAAKTKGIQVQLWNNLIMKEGIGLKLKNAITTNYLTAQTKLLAIWTGNASVATKIGTTIQWLWNAALAANPIGLVIAGLTALVAVVTAYTKYNSQAIALDKLKGGTTALLTGLNNNLSKSYKEIQEQMGKISTLSAQEKQDLQDKIDLKIKDAQVTLAQMKLRQQQIGSESSKMTPWQNLRLGAATSQSQRDQWQSVFAFQNSKEAMDPYNEGIEKASNLINELISQKKVLLDITTAESIADKIVTKTQDALTEKLSKYQVALRNTTAGSEDFKRIQDKIKETNKELAKFDQSDPDGKKKIKTEYEKLNSKIQEYLELLQKQVSTDPEQAAITGEKIRRLELEKKKIDDLVKSYTELNNTKLFEDANIPFGQEDWNKPSGKSEDTNRLIEDANIPFGQEDFKVEDNKDTNVWGQEGGALGVDVWGGKAEAVISYANTVMGAISGVDSAMSAYENAQLAKDEAANNQKKANLKRQLDAKLISQKQYDAGITKMDADLDKKKRELAHKQAVRAKELAVVQAIINVAQAVTSALSAGPIIGIILAALVGALGAIQIGYILSTPVPQAAKGRYNVTGKDDGRKYSNVPYESNFTGIPGQPMLVNETGREIVIDPKTTRNIEMNYPQIIDAIEYVRVPQRASGAYPSSAPGSSSPVPYVITMDPEYLAAIKEDHEARKKPLQAVIVYDNLITEQNKITRINSDTSK